MNRKNFYSNGEQLVLKFILFVAFVIDMSPQMPARPFRPGLLSMERLVQGTHRLILTCSPCSRVPVLTLMQNVAEAYMTWWQNTWMNIPINWLLLVFQNNRAVIQSCLKLSPKGAIWINVILSKMINPFMAVVPRNDLRILLISRFVTKSCFGKYLKGECSSGIKLQLSFLYFVNLCLFSKLLL